MDSVSIVIPFHSDANYLLTCLGSLECALGESDEIIVVVNNERADEALGLDAFPRVRPIYFSQRLGFSKACNIGARMARGNFLFFCDADTLTLTPEILQVHRLEFERNEKVGATSSLHLSPATGKIADFGLGWSGYNIFHPFRGAPLSDPRLQQSRRVQMASSAHMMTPRAIFLSMGGFDEELQYHYQDTDYCARLKDLDLQVRVTPASRTFHRGSSARVNRTPFRTDDRALFTAKNTHRLVRDYANYFNESLALWQPKATLAEFCNVAILSTIFDPRQILEPLSAVIGLRPHTEHHLIERDAGAIDLFELLGRNAAMVPDPFVFVVDAIGALRFNAIWKHLRGEQGDIAVDRHGELRPTRDLFE